MLGAAFFLLALINISRHEMWRDELQTWLTAKDSGSLIELVHNMRYDGHPGLWHLLLYCLSSLTDNPAAMQLLHLAIATATVYVLARYSPFTKLQKTLFCFGYFPLYEYGTISRNYGLGLFLIFCFCAVFRAGPTKKYLVPAVILSALMQTTAYGLMIALALALIPLCEIVSTPRRRDLLRAKGLEMVIAASLFLAAVFLSVVQLLPPKDSGYAVGWQHHESLTSIVMTLNIVWRSFVPIPELSQHFWNSNIMPADFWIVPHSVVMLPGSLLFSCVLLPASWLFFIRKPIALFSYFFGTAVMLAFTCFKFYGFQRHHGHIFVLFIACLWIAERCPEQWLSRSTLDTPLTRAFAKHSGRILVAILLVHTAAAAIACGIDWAQPFSQSKRVADFVRRAGMADMFIVGDADYAVSPVAGWLNRKLYYPQGNRIGSFIIWDQRRLNWDPQNLIKTAKEKAAERREDILVISSTQQKIDDSSVIGIGEFTGSIAPEEEYYLYLIKYEAPVRVARNVAH